MCTSKSGAGRKVQGANLCVGSLARQRGISLIELIMFIVIVSVALAGILLVMNQVTRGSVDPIVHKQALAIAESLLEEVELMPFTYCDPDDPTATTAASATACTVQVENNGLEAAFAPYQAAAEARASLAAPFDNVNDYHGFSMAAGAIQDITGSNSGLNGYTLQPIVVAPVTLSNVAANDALLITVTVMGPDHLPVVVEGIRTRYAPRTTP